MRSKVYRCSINYVISLATGFLLSLSTGLLNTITAYNSGAGSRCVLRVLLDSSVSARNAGFQDLEQTMGQHGLDETKEE